MVVYNPKKGYGFTKEVLKHLKALNVKTLALEKLSRDEMEAILKRAKVYLEFGSLPGKDRIPREAIMLGCCVLMGKNGSGKYREDFPLPEKYLFDCDLIEIPRIVKAVQSVLSQYTEEIAKYEFYRRIIRDEKRLFSEHLKNIFVPSTSRESFITKPHKSDAK